MLTPATAPADERPPVLVARDLVKEYARGRAVDGISLTVRAGERLGLLGPNGAGKTTTLLMSLGAVEPDSGSVEILGHRLPGDRARAMQGVGFVAGYLPLPDRVRVSEYLRLYADLYGLRDPHAAVSEALERFGIGHLAAAIGTQLSSGQRTLVGIAKAALHRPRLMILDEPTASLDPDIALRVRTALLALSAERGTALLVTSHDMTEVERLCERVVFLHAGRIAADGSPGDVARTFGRDDLEGVFLHLAAERDRERARQDRTPETAATA
ncbi:ABC transporter ATP-binding protein [Streptomyces sp. NBC_00237]|uniref:ABC transporter ATP-binding protein n=1 Tax=Streptomyces sp. NBC_00237 TaxID=2975687 RepID=UPI00225B79CC|nr:ABC transporter ATP-binding protein [Streptomyces sp. NBC_00237]MCX5203517.1 ABC transporter ATP-binding protein [Streptomyces sp. NBC_00237]